MNRFESLQDSLLQGHPLECSVCLERMRDISHLITYPDKQGLVCDHHFCTKCIEPIVELAKSKGKEAYCPTCRRTVISISKARIANELLQEIEKEREERKLVLRQKEDLSRACDQLVQEKQDLEDQIQEKSQGIESMNKQLFSQKEKLKMKEQMENDVALLKQKYESEIKKLRHENKKMHEQLSSQQSYQEILKKKDEQIEVLTSQLTDLSNVTEQLQKTYTEHEQKVSLEKSQADGLTKKLCKEVNSSKEKISTLTREILETKSEKDKMQKEIQELKSQMISMADQVTLATKQLEVKIEESEKWQRAYLQLKEELRLHSSSLASTAQSPNKIEKSESSYSSGLSSWLTPINKISSPISSYLKWGTAPKSGRLIRVPSEYKFIERRGSSWNSSVWRGVFKSAIGNGEAPVALKKIPTHLSTMDAFREVMLLDKLDHKNIVKLQGLLRDVPNPGNADQLADFMILPFITYDLEFLLSDWSTFRRAKQTKWLLYQLLCAVYYLHSADICHRDLRPTSVLIDESYVLKLGGFTHARSVYSSPYPSLGIHRYTSPEAVYITDMKPQELKSTDIWMCGVMFAQMLLGSPLFDAKEKQSLLCQVFSISECRPMSATVLDKYPVLNCVPSNIKVTSLAERLRDADAGQDALDLLQKMLHFDPAKRLTAAEALQHPYFTSSKLVDIHKSCGFASELKDDEIPNFVNNYCGGL